MNRRWLAAPAVLLSLVVGCTDVQADGPDAVVVVRNVHFEPMDVTVPVGGTVQWRFEDGGLLHHVGSDGVFDSGITSEGSYEHTFDAPGVYEYHCSVHRYMTGTVTVTG